MKCQYCAEEIQDEAVLCRFCGARKLHEVWLAPGENPRVQRGNFTIISTGFLLLVSGAWSLGTLTTPVALFGDMRGGIVAVLYNSLFAGLFGAMGFALMRRAPWALMITLATSIAYTFDKLELLLDVQARTAALGDLGSGLGEFGSALDQGISILALVFLLFWWLFAGYLYLKRDYFRPSARV